MKKSILFFLSLLISAPSAAQVKLLSSNPAAGAVSVDQAFIELEFDQPIELDLEDPESSGFNFVIEPEDMVTMPGITISEDQQTVTITVELMPDTDYMMVLGNVLGTNGDKLERPQVIQFTTAAEAGAYTVSGTVSSQVLKQLKLTEHGMNGVGVFLSSSPYPINFMEEEEDEGFIPTYGAMVDTVTGAYSISGIREGTYYLLGFDLIPMFSGEDTTEDFFLPEIYIYDPDENKTHNSITLNATTTTNNELTGIDLYPLDYSPMTFSNAVQNAELLLETVENTPSVAGGSTYYFGGTYEEEPAFKTARQELAASWKLPAITLDKPKRKPFNRRFKTAEAETDDPFSYFGNPNGESLIWEIYAYDEVKDSVLSVMITPVGSGITGYIGLEDADLPQGVTFTDIKLLPETFIDSDQAASIAESNGGTNFRNRFSTSGSDYGFWDMELQALHEFWTYEPDPTPSAPVFWKASYFGETYSFESNEYIEDSLSIYMDIATGEILHISTSMEEAITFSQAVDIAQAVFDTLPNSPYIVGGGTFYQFFNYEDEPDETAAKRKTKSSFSLLSTQLSEEETSHFGYQTEPNGYQLGWEIYGYDAEKDSAVGVQVSASGAEFIGYIGLDEAEFPEGVTFASIKPLPDTFIDSDEAAAIIEAEGGAAFRAKYSESTTEYFAEWELELFALHEYWTYEPDPTPDAPIMWKGWYSGYKYDYETEEYHEDSLLVFLDIETGEVLFKTPVSNQQRPELPETIQLLQNYPNPFNPSTNIPFELNRDALVSLTIYNMLGQKVATLVRDRYPAGSHTIQWEATGMASGVYFYRLQAGETIQTRKLLLMK